MCNGMFTEPFIAASASSILLIVFFYIAMCNYIVNLLNCTLCEHYLISFVDFI